jgi:hypothetical protein
MQQIFWDLFKNFLLGGLIVASISYIATYVDPLIGAIWWSFPLTLVTSLWFMHSHGKNNTYLAKFAKFLVQNKDLKYSKKLIKKGFNLFISNQIRQFDNCKDVELHFVGSIGFYLKDELEKRIKKKNMKLGKVLRRPIEGLVAYHQGL